MLSPGKEAWFGGEATETRDAGAFAMADRRWVDHLNVAVYGSIAECGSVVTRRRKLDTGAGHSRNQLLSLAMRGYNINTTITCAVRHWKKSRDQGVSVMCDSVAVDRIGGELIGLNPFPTPQTRQ
ncbi:hypothetical protein VM1G_05024 [Cytospora mali]|uniref:Uncharacterized protein n=1 Tax=Cytospora mali TaxID=578113 RepID=A0A194VZ22_CYTMA|nr:hypothetical protein VM1G_05024 [Valsa mali]